MTEYKNIIIVETNEAGQPTNLRRLEDGDTISNERLNADVRNAADKIDTVETTANNALSEAEAVSSTVYDNSGGWGAGGIDPGLLADITEVSVGFGDFSGNIETSSRNMSGIVDDLEASARNIETSSRNMSGIVDDLEASARNIETSSRNMSGIVDDLETSSRNMSGIVDDLETSARNIETSARDRSAALDGSTNFPNTIADGTFDQIGELKTNLNCAGFNIESPGTVDGVDISTRNLVLTNLETSSRNMSSIVDGSFTDLETSSRNMSSIVKGDIEALEAQVPSADGFDNWNTIYADRNNIKSVSASVAASDTAFLNGATPTLSNNLAGGGNDINNINKIRTDNVQTKLETGTLGVSGPNLSLFGEASVRIGKSSSNFATTDFKASADNWVGTYHTVYSNSGTWGGGGGGAGNFEGSAIASAISIGNSSSVAISGTDGAALDLPENNMVLVLDTENERFKYSKIRSPMILDGAVGVDSLADGSVDTNKLATDLDIAGNIAANNIGFNKLTLVNAQTLIGNPNPTLGGPMQALTPGNARAILNSSPGVGAQLDHGSLSGLADDDHTQYLLADGSRDLGGNILFNDGTADGMIGNHLNFFSVSSGDAFLGLYGESLLISSTNDITVRQAGKTQITESLPDLLYAAKRTKDSFYPSFLQLKEAAGAQNINQASKQYVEFDTVDTSGGAASTDYTHNGSDTITINTAGTYEVTFSIAVSAQGTGSTNQRTVQRVQMEKNSTQIGPRMQTGYIRLTSNTNKASYHMPAFILDLAATDTLKIGSTRDGTSTGGVGTIADACFWTIKRIL